jgi:hypothetical protein
MFLKELFLGGNFSFLGAAHSSVEFEREKKGNNLNL